MLWRTGTDAADGLFDAVFENVPVALEEELAVPIRRGDDLLLAVLSPEEGKLLREVPLIGPPTRFSPPGGGGACWSMTRRRCTSAREMA